MTGRRPPFRADPTADMLTDASVGRAGRGRLPRRALLPCRAVLAVRACATAIVAAVVALSVAAAAGSVTAWCPTVPR